MQSRIAWSATVALLLVEGALQVGGYTNQALAALLLGGAAIAAAVGWYFASEEGRQRSRLPTLIWGKLPLGERRLLGLMKNGHGVLGNVPPRGRNGAAWGVPLETFHSMLDRLIALDVLIVTGDGRHELSPLGRQVLQLAQPHDGPITEAPAKPWTSLIDVAKLAYEETRNTAVATAAEREGNPDNTLSYYCIAISRNEPIYGTPLPSSVMEKIDLGSHHIDVKDGVAFIRDPYKREPTWANLSVKSENVPAILSRIKAMGGVE